LNERSNRFKSEEELRQYLIKLLEMKNNMQKEIIKENPTIIKTPLGNNNKQLNASDSKTSLAQDSQFVPLHGPSTNNGLQPSNNNPIGSSHFARKYGKSKQNIPEMPILNGMILEDSTELPTQAKPSYTRKEPPVINRQSKLQPINPISRKDSSISQLTSKYNFTKHLSTNLTPAVSGDLYRSGRHGIMANDFPSMNSHGSLITYANGGSNKKNQDYTPLMNNLVDIANKLEKSVTTQHERINRDLAEIHKELNSIKSKEIYLDKYRTSSQKSALLTPPDLPYNRSPVTKNPPQKKLDPKSLIDVVPKSLLEAHNKPTVKNQTYLSPPDSKSAGYKLSPLDQPNEPYTRSIPKAEQNNSRYLKSDGRDINNYSSFPERHESQIPSKSNLSRQESIPRNGEYEHNKRYDHDLRRGASINRYEPEYARKGEMGVPGISGNPDNKYNSELKGLRKSQENPPVSFGKVKKLSINVIPRRRGLKRRRDEYLPEYVPENNFY